MLPNHSAAPQLPAAKVVVAGSVLLALLFGLAGAVFGAEAQLMVVLLGVPAVAMILDQRLGLFLFVMLAPYNGAVDVPRMVQNIVYFGICALFFVRLMMTRVVSGGFELPLPKEFILYVLLFTGATAIGITHLHEITPAYLFKIRVDTYGLKEYVVGFYARQLTLVIMAAIVVWLLVAKRSRPDWIINTALASGALFVLLMLAVLAARGFPLSELRTRTFFMVLGRQSNSLGGLLYILLASVLYMREMAKGAGRRSALLALAVLLVIGVVLSASRGAVLAMLMIFFLYVVEFRRVRAAFAGALILASAALLAPESIQERIFQGLDSGGVEDASASAGFQDRVTSGRLYIWSRLAPEVLNSPLVGSGLASSQWSEFARSGEYFATHPHNLYLAVLMDTGLVGAVIMFLFYRYIWRSFRMLGRDDRLAPHIQGYFRGAAAALIAYLVAGLPNGNWDPSQDQTYLWVAIGLAIGTRAVLGPRPEAVVAASRGAMPGRIGRHFVHRGYR